MVLIEVREDMEDLGKVPFSRKHQERIHHGDLTAYINSTEIQHPKKNTNQ